MPVLCVVTPLLSFWLLAVTDSSTEPSHKSHLLNHIYHFSDRGGDWWGKGGGWTRRAGREGKAPQMKILNQNALLLQLRPRLGLDLIYSLKPGNQAIKRNQTIRFPALNGPTVWCGQPGIWLNPFEVADKHQRQQPCLFRWIYLLTLGGCRRRKASARLCALTVTRCVDGTPS